MGIDMYLGDAQTQAAGVSTRSSTHVASYTAMIAAVEAFCAEDSLTGRAYTSAKGYCTNYVLPLLQGAILFDEALAQDCQSYVTAYESNVDSKSWREEDLRQQIANQDTLLRELADLSERASKKSVRRSLSRQIASAQGVRTTLQTILDNLLAFNASSTEYFTNSQSLYASLSSGLKEMSGSWQSSTKTYASPTSYDVTWRTVIADGWEKRQAIVERPESMTLQKTTASTVEMEVVQMSWSELRQNYLAIVKTREQSRQTGYGYAVTSADDLKRDQLIVARYEAEAKQHTDDSHVSKAFQAKIKAMSLDELKEKYPYVNSYNPYYAHQVLFNFDKRSKAKQLYIIKRYYELESKETVSVRSQDFMGDYVKGINETGINPFTGKAVDKGTQTMAEAYQSFRGVSQTLASISAAVADFSGLFVEDNVNQTPPPNYREQVLKNIEESRLARKSSNFNKYLEIEGATKKYLRTLNDMSLEDRQHYQQWNKYAEAGLSPADRVRVLEISDNAPKVEYTPGSYTKQEILDIKPNADEGVFRPDVEDYLSSDYIEAHRRQFENGAAKFQKFQPSESWNNGVVGGKDGTSFWLSKEHADIIQDVAKGDNRLYETLLGFDEGDLGDGPLYRLDVSPEVVAEKGISIPSGNEAGANEWWRPGGRTYPGDMPEGVMEGISTKEGDHTWNVVN